MNDLKKLVEQTIPIYTFKNPHPTRKRPNDCDIEKSVKEGWRLLMLKELHLMPCDMWDTDWDLVVEKYKRKVAEI